MPHPPLVILGYSEASMFLRGGRGDDVATVVSIHSQREFGVETGGRVHRLDLSFDDVEVLRPDDVESMLRVTNRRRWAEQNGLTETAPTAGDTAAIVAFAERVREVDGVVLCHCGAGVSRAPAAALICLAVWRGPGAEAECGEAVRKLRRGAMPHRSLIAFADDLLGRRGRLVEVVREAP